MDAKHTPLSDVPAGGLVLINWPDKLNLGINATMDGNPFVVVLIDEVDGIAGPHGIAVDDAGLVVSLGRKWGFEFEVNELQMGNGGRPPLGSIFITDSGLNIVCHVEDVGGRVVSQDGIISRPDWVRPFVANWELYLSTDNGDDTQILLGWPIELAPAEAD